MSTKEEYHGLYQTLLSSSTQKSFTKAQTRSLKEKMNNLDLESKKECFLLLCEHARIEGLFEYNEEGPQILPYGVSVKENGDIEFNISNIPTKLKHMLSKFCDVACSRSQQ